MKIFWGVLFLLILGNNYQLKAQLTNKSDTVSVPAPIIDSISVENDSQVLITWHNDTVVEIQYYQLHIYQNIIPYLRIEFLSADLISFVDQYSKPNLQPVAYRLFYYYKPDSSRSLISDTLYTIFVQITKFDTCDQSLRLNWNPYLGWNEEILYKVYSSQNQKGPFNLVGETNNTLFDVTNLEFKKDYYFKIRATSNQRSSTSNLTHIYTKPLRKPSYAKGMQCISTENENQLSFQFDGATYISKVELYRSNDGISEILQSWLNPVGYEWQINDAAADTGIVYSYFIKAYDRCNILSIESDSLKNIVLQVSVNNQGWNHLLWNKSFDLSDETFSVLRNEPPAIFETAFSGIQYNDVVEGTDYPSGLFCYQVKATAPHRGTSISNQVCITRQTEYILPEAFTPNGDGKHDEFKPEIYFGGQDYLLIIYNRWGQKVFETNNPSQGWDGTINGHEPVQGTYLYFLRLRTSTGKKIKKNGEVSLFLP